MSLKKELKMRLFELAVRKGYCDIYSSYEVTESAIKHVADEIFNKRTKK